MEHNTWPQWVEDLYEQRAAQLSPDSPKFMSLGSLLEFMGDVV